MKTVVYPGTFDPITNGHLDIIKRASGMFDQVIVMLAVNSKKKTLFSEEERLALAAEALQGHESVVVKTTSGLIVEAARKEGAVAIVRGLRAVSDFESEMQMALMNRKMEGDISTIFLMPNERYTYLNSSIIRELASYKADIAEFVPDCVQRALERKFA